MDNKTRDKLEKLKSQIEDIKTEVEQYRDEEEKKFDNLSEGLQASERGQRIEAAKDALCGAVDDLESAMSCIDEAVGA